MYTQEGARRQQAVTVRKDVATTFRLDSGGRAPYARRWPCHIDLRAHSSYRGLSLLKARHGAERERIMKKRPRDEVHVAF